MGSLSAVIVAAALGAVVAAPMMQLTVAQAQSRAQLEARVLYQSEVERARRLWSLDYEDFDLLEPHSDRCVFNTPDNGGNHAYTAEGFNFDVTCTVGRQGVGKHTALLPYPAHYRTPGQFTDMDGDGFEDITGLPTHYDQCYNGWKGDGFNDNKNGCILGDQYVIPMYAGLYENGQPIITDPDQLQ